MKKLLGAAVAALLVVGVVKCAGSPSPEKRARMACENLAKQCDGLVRINGEEITADDIEECVQDVTLAAHEEDVRDQYNELTGCLADASSCGAALGCVFSVLEANLETDD